MNLEEVKRVIHQKELTRYRLFEDSHNEPNIVGINKNGLIYEVYAANERGTLSGIKRYTSESEALENFISRLETLNRLLKKKPNDYL